MWTRVKFVQIQILPEQQRNSMNQLWKMIYYTAAQQQLCVGNKAVAPKLFMRYNKRIVAIRGEDRTRGKMELRRGNSGVQSEHLSVRWK